MRLRLNTRAVVVPIALATLVAGGAIVANAATTNARSDAAVPNSAVPNTAVPDTAVPVAALPTPAASPVVTRTCSDASLLFCEDFDRSPRGAAGSLRWGLDTRNATMTVAWAGRGVPARARGSQALHLHTVDNGRAFLTVNDLALQGKPLYGRMRLKVQAFPTAPDWAHFTLVEATGSGSTEIVRPVGGQYAPTNAKTMWGIGADGGPTGDWTNWRESAPTVAGTWQCVEWKLDPQGNQVQTWFDGVDNPDLTASTNQHGGKDVPFTLPAVNTVKIGWQLYQGGTTPKGFDVWLDDVALATSRVGC